MVGEVGKAAHPPFGADVAPARHSFEHFVDRELQAKVTTSAEVTQIEESVNNGILANGWSLNLFDECFGVHCEIVVQRWDY